MKKINTKTFVKLGMEESFCGIPDLYTKLAELECEVVPEDIRYDCTKIEVAKNVADNMFAYMESRGIDKASQGMMWCIYGPKTNEALEDDTVVYEKGFMYVEPNIKA